MKLRSMDILALHRRGNTSAAISSISESTRRASWPSSVGVHEIHLTTCRKSLQNTPRPSVFVHFRRISQGVPAHVRNLVDRPAGVGIWDTLNDTGNNTKTAMLAELVTFFKQDLHADTNAEQWSPRRYELVQRFNQAAKFKLPHAVRECAHPRQYKPFGAQNLVWVARHYDVSPAMGERSLGAEQISNAVIDNHRWRGSHSTRTGI